MKKTLGTLLISLSAMSFSVQADNVVVVGHSNAPMFTVEGSGREAEVISATLERCGHTVSFEIQPFVRHWSSFKNGTGDAVATVPVGMDLGGTATAPYFYYQNGVSMLKDQPFTVDSVDDLAGKRVVAFKNAKNILPELKGKTRDFKNYREISDQSVHSQLLFANRVDAVIGDGMIFAEYINSLRDSTQRLKFDPNQEIEFKSVFLPSPRMMVFRNPRLAADFDRCFKQVEADGTIARINSEWTDKYRDVLSAEYLGY